MSDPVSALKGARFEGIASVSDCGPAGMITLRGDLSSASLQKAAGAASGQAMPAPHRISGGLDAGLAWMSPDELLVLCPYAAVGQRLADLESGLESSHALAVDVSDARAVLRVSGLRAREVLAKLCPVDLAPSAFGPGQFRRTRMAQIPAALWMRDADTFHVVCFRSVTDYAFAVLKVAAQPGSEVRHF